MKINNSNKIALLISVYVFFRIFNANSLIFSYDFINYLDYFDKIMVMDWNEFYENLNMTFPFVLIDFKLFEFLFVFIVKILLIFFNSKISYALLASVGTAGRTLLASSSGALVDGLDGNWGLFFIITALMVVPSLICLVLIKNKINFNKN